MEGGASLIDPYGRTIKGIRISLTQRCNLNCTYCHHEGEAAVSTEMTIDEVLKIVKIAAGLGVIRVKYTGGEPLLRSDLNDIIRGTISMKLEDVALTTNGSLLRARAKGLAETGLRRLNISLASMVPDVYFKLTGGDLKDALDGIREARKLGMEIKLNMVIMKGINTGEVDRFMGFARNLGCSLQLIELEDLNLDPGFFSKYHQDISEIEEEIEHRAQRVTKREDMNHRAKYLVDGMQVEVVRPIDNPNFCKRCTRLRVTSDGKLKPCLMRSDDLIDLLKPMRRGSSDAELRGLFLKAVSLRAPYYRPRG
jgi:cyclic pyranopterin phosphate synthase